MFVTCVSVFLTPLTALGNDAAAQSVVISLENGVDIHATHEASSPAWRVSLTLKKAGKYAFTVLVDGKDSGKVNYIVIE